MGENTGRKKSLYAHHRTNFSGCIFVIKAYIENRKILLNNNISSTCPHNTVNFGPLTVEIDWWVWGTPANFNRFRVLASLLHRRCSTEVNQILHDVWPSSGLIHYVFILGGLLPPWRNFSTCKIYFAFKSCIILYWQRYCTALEQWASDKLRYGTRNAIKDLLQTAPPLFGGAAITVGIGPHSSWQIYSHCTF